MLLGAALSVALSGSNIKKFHYENNNYDYSTSNKSEQIQGNIKMIQFYRVRALVDYRTEVCIGFQLGTLCFVFVEYLNLRMKSKIMIMLH